MSKDHSSQAYLNALSAMQTLLDKEGVNSTRYAFAEVIEPYAKQWFAVETNPPLTLSRSDPCIHKLQRKQCRADQPCPIIPGADHLSLWNYRGKPYAIVSQPYDFSYESMIKTVGFCQLHGLAARISAGQSWHFPGDTIAIIYTRKKDQ